MKLQKNKIVFISIVGLVLIFIIAYGVQLSQEDEIPTLDTNKIPIPELEQQQEDYSSKLDAINDIKEVRHYDAPSMYDERLLDSNGIYDPDLLDKEKQRIVDSIYNQGKINYTSFSYRDSKGASEALLKPMQDISTINESFPAKNNTNPRNAIITSHQDFFKNTPQINKPETSFMKMTDTAIVVVVNGDQQVKAYSRLEMRTVQACTIGGRSLPKNTLLYGFVSFKPNRTIVQISNIEHHAVKLQAYDLQDGKEGIYVVNSFKTDVSKAVLSDVIQDVNIPGVPSVDVIKNVFQRSNKNLKVTITNNYKLLLKPVL
jgi:hypothetical protein